MPSPEVLSPVVSGSGSKDKNKRHAKPPGGAIYLNRTSKNNFIRPYVYISICARTHICVARDVRTMCVCLFYRYRCIYLHRRGIHSYGEACVACTHAYVLQIRYVRCTMYVQVYLVYIVHIYPYHFVRIRDSLHTAQKSDVPEERGAQQGI